MVRQRLRPDRWRRAAVEAGSVVLGVVLLVWTLLPVYTMLLVALDPEEGEIEFDGNIWPPEPSLEGFRSAVMQEARYLEHFWQQFGNSILIGVAVMLLTMLIASLASFAVGRMRLARGSLLINAALLTYVIPASFLIFPFYRIVTEYGLMNSIWAVIAAQTTFATPFAIVILLRYGALLPFELDDAARLDGASAPQIYRRIYLPLMAPALAIVGTYALLLAWNDYIYQAVLLSWGDNMTLSVTQSNLFGDTDPPYNAFMAAAVLYALPPVAIFYALRRTIAAGVMPGEALV
jgi:multiple sugar transport system permease protein